MSFWVLALDHDLQIAKDTIGLVSVKNPAGTKVAVWDQVSLDEGKCFSLRCRIYSNNYKACVGKTVRLSKQSKNRPIF